VVDTEAAAAAADDRRRRHQRLHLLPPAAAADGDIDGEGDCKGDYLLFLIFAAADASGAAAGG
jgi:hypothetical protein